MRQSGGPGHGYIQSPTQTTQHELGAVKGAAALQPHMLSCSSSSLCIDLKKTKDGFTG